MYTTLNIVGKLDGTRSMTKKSTPVIKWDQKSFPERKRGYHHGRVCGAIDGLTNLSAKSGGCYQDLLLCVVNNLSVEVIVGTEDSQSRLFGGTV